MEKISQIVVYFSEKNLTDLVLSMHKISHLTVPFIHFHKYQQSQYYAYYLASPVISFEKRKNINLKFVNINAQTHTHTKT